MWLVVGLGNPGREHAAHRHNLGFMVVDRIAEGHASEPFRTKFAGHLARARLEGEDALLFKPMTYMNLSGDAVQPCAAFFRVPVERIVVVHDELDLGFGTVRLKKGGGHAGHNGLRSLVARLGTADFVRVRIGIGRPAEGFRGDAAAWVLSPFDAAERAALSDPLRNAAQSVLDIAARGLEAAMQTTNTPPERRRRHGRAPEGEG
jgi:PTH1 family peptidyl-tRNA hydrolase